MGATTASKVMASTMEAKDGTPTTKEGVAEAQEGTAEAEEGREAARRRREGQLRGEDARGHVGKAREQRGAVGNGFFSLLTRSVFWAESRERFPDRAEPFGSHCLLILQMLV